MTRKNQISISQQTCIVAARTDGFGERMCALLNAMAVSKLSGLEFKFSWVNPSYDLYFSQNIKNLNDNQVLIPFANFPTKQELFQDDFIQKYGISDDYRTLTGFLKFSLKELEAGAYSQNGVVYIHQDFLMIEEVEEEEYRALLPQCFKEIPFTSRIKNCINFANKCAKGFKKKFVAIHIRTGDFIYLSMWQTYSYCEKGFNVYLAIEIIKQELECGNSVVLFSDDLQTTQTIKQIFSPARNVYSIDDFFNRSEFLGYEQSIFEILFMSFAEKIYSGNSGFSRLAMMIGGKQKISPYAYFSLEQQAQIIANSFSQYAFHPAQQAFALMQLFIIGQKIKMEIPYLTNCIKTAYQLFPRTPYDVLCIFGLLQNKNFAEANTFLEQFYQKNRAEFLRTLLEFHNNQFIFDFSFAYYFTALNAYEFPYVNYFALKIAIFIQPLSISTKISIPNAQMIFVYLSDRDFIAQFLSFLQASGLFQEIYPIVLQIDENLKKLNNLLCEKIS